jgi:hypothetical protein
VLRVCVAATPLGTLYEITTFQATGHSRTAVLGCPIQIATPAYQILWPYDAACANTVVHGPPCLAKSCPLSVLVERATCRSISEHGSPELRDLMAIKSLFAHRQRLPMTFGLRAVCRHVIRNGYSRVSYVLLVNIAPLSVSLQIVSSSHPSNTYRQSSSGCTPEPLGPLRSFAALPPPPLRLKALHLPTARTPPPSPPITRLAPLLAATSMLMLLGSSSRLRPSLHSLPSSITHLMCLPPSLPL